MYKDNIRYLETNLHGNKRDRPGRRARAQNSLQVRLRLCE